MDGLTNHFFEKFLDFWWPRRRFSTILGPKTGPRGLLFRCFFKNGDFVKIVLPLWWEHSFQGLDLPKIDLEIDCERQRRTTSKKIASDAVSERTFSVPGSFLVDFGVPLGSQDGLFGPTFGGLWADFRDCFVTFWVPVGSHVVFLCSRVLGEGAGPDSGCSGDPPGRNLKTIFNDSLRRVAS